MPRGMFKSGRLRKIFVKTPGGRVTVHYRERKPSKALCASCKKQLAGVPRERPAKMRNMPKTAKRPERPYGGMLCSACTRLLLKQRTRGASQ
ncbi:50S ribosomal protein L34e [Candidatus Woesearchaeota archaeon]|nr:50S ribosomal protein L34e [Candidatus Woesearchaeota archaeon]